MTAKRKLPRLLVVVVSLTVALTLATVGAVVYAAMVMATKAGAEGQSARAAMAEFLADQPTDPKAQGMRSSILNAFWADYHHNVDVTFNPKAGTFQGTDRIKLRVLKKTARLGIALGMDNQIDEVRLNGQPLAREVNLFLLPAEKQAANTELELTVTFHGTGPQIGNLLANNITITDRVIQALGFFPRGWSGPMTGRVTVHLPPGWHAGLPGRLAESKEDAAGTTDTYVIDQPMRVIHLMAEPAPLRTATVNGREMHMLGNLSEADAALWLKTAGDILAFYSKTYNRPYPFGELTVVALSDIGGNVGAFAFPGIFTTDLRVEKLQTYAYMTHELGHEWWGSSVGAAGYASMFLSESITEYMAWKCAAALGYIPLTQNSTIAVYRYRHDARPFNEEALRTITSPDMLPNRATAYYARGPQVWYMLNQQLGDAQFAELLRQFAAHQWWQPLHYDLFRDSAINLGGNAASTFVDQWIDRAAEPSLEYRAVKVTKNGASYTITGSIHQKPEQGDKPWRLVSELAVFTHVPASPYGLRSDKSFPLVLTETDTPFSVTVDFPPAAVLYDPLFKTMTYNNPVLTLPAPER